MPEVVSIDQDDDLDDDFGDDDGPVGRPMGLYVAIGVVAVLLVGVVFFLFRGGGGDGEKTAPPTTTAVGTPLDATDSRALAIGAVVDAWAQHVNSGGDTAGLTAYFDPDGTAYAKRLNDTVKTADGEEIPLTEAGPRTDPYSVSVTDFVLIDDAKDPVIEATTVWTAAGTTNEYRFRFTLRASTEGKGWRVWSIDAAEGGAASATPATFCEAAKVASELDSNAEVSDLLKKEKTSEERTAKYLEITNERLAAFRALAATAPNESAQAAADTAVAGFEAQAEILGSGKPSQDIDKALQDSRPIALINQAATGLSSTTQTECGVTVAFE